MISCTFVPEMLIYQGSLICCYRFVIVFRAGNKDEISLDEDSAHLGCFISKRANEQMIEQEGQKHS